MLTDGRESTIRRRPVPSAGAAYPVHTHLLVGADDQTGLEGGRYVVDTATGRLFRRPGTARGADGGSQIVFTVAPGRTFARYRHRAWPLWIADTAYAVAAVEFLLGTAVRLHVGPSRELRDSLAVPLASNTRWWLDRGLAPEIPLAAVELPAGWRIRTERARVLSVRRSAALPEFQRNRSTCPAASSLATLSRQEWVSGADRVLTWTVTLGEPDALLEHLWRVHRDAASTLYRSCLTGRWWCRPVSGIPARGDVWTVHALAMLRARSERNGS
ncbi:hypothetical protein [Gordonia malaquae]|uniref:hypothetical protein n=1 Tax=Gordonia malaquae TaxID=410332 RepID=UPI0030FE7E01